MSAIVRSWARSSWPPSMRTRSMKYSSSSSCGSSTAVRPPSMPGLALGVEAPPAEPAAQVGRVDGGEAAVRVDVLDPGADVERVVVLLRALVGVERLAVAERPLPLAARLARGARPGAAAWRWCCVTAIAASSVSSSWGRARATATPGLGPATTVSERPARDCAPENGNRAASASRTHGAAHAAVVDVATSHEAALHSGSHVAKDDTTATTRPPDARRLPAPGM